MAAASRMTGKAGRSGVERATGRDRPEWFELLDTWGGLGRPFREIADHLKSEHGLSHWWAQKLIVEYEQARGVRPPGVRPGGTFSVTASKTVNVPVTRVFQAFTDPGLRRRWLAGAKMRVRTSDENHSARFDWLDGGTRVGVTFIPKGRTKSLVGVEHSHLPNTKEADKTKAYWRERLAALKHLLEEGEK